MLERSTVREMIAGGLVRPTELRLLEEIREQLGLGSGDRGQDATCIVGPADIAGAWSNLQFGQ